MTFSPRRFSGPDEITGKQTPPLPPATLFGKRLVIVPNPRVPKDHIVFAVNPEVYEQTKEQLHDAFAKWKTQEKAK